MRLIFPVGLTEAEQALVKRLGKRSKFYVFMRTIRHQLFDDAMQEQLETMFSDKPRGTPPIPAAQLVLMALLQAYDSVSDDDAIEHAIANDRWKLVLGTLGSNASPCSKKTLVFFRQRMVKHNMGDKVLAKTPTHAMGGSSSSTNTRS
jgi:transposase